MYLVYRMISSCFKIFVCLSFDNLFDKAMSSQSRRFCNMTMKKELSDVINTRTVSALPI